MRFYFKQKRKDLHGTVCIYHYFTIGYMHIKCDFTLNKREKRFTR